MDHFFERTVPDAIEEQSGPVVRQMLKSRESFDIENTKLRAREAAIIAKFKVRWEWLAGKGLEGAALGNCFTPVYWVCCRTTAPPQHDGLKTRRQIASVFSPHLRRHSMQPS